MRILAIRGEGLASLAARFEISLTSPPLDRAGLLAISGPTGSGKSTILDAMCLALFDRMPRVSEARGKVEIGRRDDPPELRIFSSDVRSILSRGAAEGWAEVDFVGRDGRAYTARWEVWRARRRVSGKLQAQSMSLVDSVTGERIGDTRSETQEMISDRLGLTFDQFRRSVLLAQGDFAAFLQARSSERSELLERITGTEIYSVLSRAAHERERDEKLLGDEIRTRLEQVTPLHDQDRAARELTREELRKRATGLEAETRARTADVSWHERDRQLANGVDEALAALEVADRSHAEAGARRESAATARRVLPLRARAEAVSVADGELAAAAAELEGARQAAVGCAELLHTVGEERAEARRALEAAVIELRETRPLIQSARQLDQRLDLTREDHAQASEAGRRKSSRARETAEAATGLRAEHERTEQTLQGATGWLEQNQGLGAISGQWDRWRCDLEEHARASQAISSSRQEQDRLQELLKELEEAGELNQAALDSISAMITTAEADVERCSRLLEQDPPGELRQRREALEQRAARLDRLERARVEMARVEAERRQAEARLRELEREASDAGLVVARSESGLVGLRAAISEAEKVRDRLLTAGAEQVTSLRGGLVSGEACPVCGSTDHPWALEDPAVDRLLDEQSSRVDELASTLRDLTGEMARAQATAERASEEAERLQSRAKDLVSRLDHVRAAWQDDAVAEAVEVDPAAEEAREQLAGLAGTVAASLADVRRREEAAAQVLAELEVARARLDGHREEQHRQEARARENERKAAALEQEMATVRARLTSSAEQLERLAPGLERVFGEAPGWSEQLVADPVAFMRRYGESVDRWRAQDASAAAARARLAELVSEIAAAEALAEHAAEADARQTAELGRVESALESLEAQRREMLDGRPADLVETELESAETRLREHDEAAAARLEDARSRAAAAEQAERDATDRLDEKKAGAQAVREALEQDLAGLGITAEELDHWLGRDEQWLERELEALRSIDEARRDAGVTLQERRRQHELHRADGVPEIDLAAASGRLEQIGRELSETREDLTALEVELRQDDASREQVSALSADLAAQENRWSLWAKMKELIGSADGSKLRTFAQGLTLEVLLGHANHQLADLAQRYRLEQATGSGLELQVVDLEMGDEVRGVSSLSGGETFLVSLALALGLASMSSDRVEVESLFIDEGFGSLDPDALDRAIACLDALQAQGRQVGVISHVPAMVERIGVGVRVEPLGGGRSRVRVLGLGPEVG